jgi:hypothetical protein
MAEKDAEIWTCHFLSRKKCGNLDFIIFNGGKRCGKLDFFLFLNLINIQLNEEYQLILTN